MSTIDHRRPTVGAEVERRTAAETEQVVDAELVSPDTGPQTVLRKPEQRTKVDILSVRPAGGRSVKELAKASPRAIVRTGYTAGQGGVGLTKRVWTAATHGFLREQIRLARATGDRQALAEWTERLEAAKDSRMTRLLQLPKTLLAVLVTIGVGVLIVAVLLLVGGIVAQVMPRDPICDALDPACVEPSGWGLWWSGVGSFFYVVATIIEWTFWLAMWAALPVGGFLAVREGRRMGGAPVWMLSAEERAEEGAEVTADAITKAMRHMQIPALTQALKAGDELVFVVPPREQGGGTYFQVRLPIGVIAAKLLPSEKVELLAGNLSRLKHEVWPQRQSDSDARVLDCWVADKGTMDKPSPVWPLLEDGAFNVFRERLPWGVTMRGDAIQVGMRQKHWLIGANSKQGKTTALRTLLLGLALDPDVELRIADLKGDGDFKMLEPMCHTYIEGQADEDAEAAVVMLEDLVLEMQRRYDEKTRLGIVGGITEQIARKRGSGFHPIFAVVDECQVMYMAGKAADGSQLGGSKDEARAQKAAKRLHDQARAVEIQLLQSTQRPDPQTVPVRVREGVHVRASLYVPNINAAKMILADAAERGARPYDLRPGRDAGTVVVAGEVEDIPHGQAFAIVRTHYVSTEQAHEVAKRAIELRARRGKHLAVVAAAPKVDHLENVLEAMRAEARVRTAVLLGRLIEIDQDYEGWGFQELKKALAGAGGEDNPEVPVRKSDGHSVVRLEDVQEALNARSGRVG